jgi:hypothetical protein
VVWFTSTSWQRDQICEPYRHAMRAAVECRLHGRVHVVWLRLRAVKYYCRSADLIVAAQRFFSRGPCVRTRRRPPESRRTSAYGLDARRWNFPHAHTRRSRRRNVRVKSPSCLRAVCAERPKRAASEAK